MRKLSSRIQRKELGNSVPQPIVCCTSIHIGVLREDQFDAHQSILRKLTLDLLDANRRKIYISTQKKCSIDQERQVALPERL